MGGCLPNYSISVLLPIRNEELHIKNSILSIINNNIFNKNMELIVIDGDSDDSTVEIVDEIIINNKDVNIILLNNPEKIVPVAMNIGIKKAKGEFIVRIDSHSVYPKNYLINLVELMLKLKADNVGGCVVTKPINKSTKSLAISKALSTPFSVGNSLFRVMRKGSAIEVDTVPFGCYRKETLIKIGLYDEDLVRNQDDELNARLRQSGGRVFLIPDIKIDYYSRDSYKKLFSMFYQYGYFKPLVNMKLKSAATYRQFVPLIFVSYIFIGFIAAILSKIALFFYMLGLLIYLFSSMVASYKATIENVFNLHLFLQIIAVFFVIHFSYGLGYILGIIDFVLMGKTTNNNTNISR